MSVETKPLEDVVRGLSPEMKRKVRDYVEHLLRAPAKDDQEPATSEPGLDADVTLQEITAETVREVCALSDTLVPPRRYMVAPNAMSLAQAHFSEYAWFRAIYAGETPVGFIMLYDDPEAAEYFLWRLMIAAPHHGKGYGSRAIELLADYVRTRPGSTVLETSCGQGPGSPEAFYTSIGFRRNGKMHEGEVGLSLVL